MFPEGFAQRLRDHKDSLFSITDRRIKRSRGSSGCTVIEYHGQLKLMVLGDSGVGKTTICSQYVGEDCNVNTTGLNSPKVSPKKNKRNCSPIVSPKKDVLFKPTKDEQYNSCVFLNGDKEDRVKQYDLNIAIPKKMYWNGSVEGYKKKIQESDCFLLIYSKENRQSYMRLIELLSDIRKLRQGNVPPIVIVGNKTDLNRNYVHVKDCERAVFGSVPHFNASARENEGIQEAFKSLAQMTAQKRSKAMSNIITDSSSK